MVFRKNYSKAIRCQTECKDPSLTAQEFEPECNLSKVMAKRTVSPPMINQSTDPLLYGDFSSGTDYKEQMNRIVEAEQQFMQLPAKLRERFHNNPQELIEFISSEENLEEAKKLGIIRNEPEKEAPIEVIIANQNDDNVSQNSDE